MKTDLVDNVNQSDEMFQESKGLPPKSGIQHELQLEQKCLLHNIGMYRMLVMERAEIKTQIQVLLNKRIIQPTPLPCGAHLILVPKKNGKHFLERDSRSGFHQSRVFEGDIGKTTFKTRQCLF